MFSEGLEVNNFKCDSICKDTYFRYKPFVLPAFPEALIRRRHQAREKGDDWNDGVAFPSSRLMNYKKNSMPVKNHVWSKTLSSREAFFNSTRPSTHHQQHHQQQHSSRSTSTTQSPSNQYAEKTRRIAVPGSASGRRSQHKQQQQEEMNTTFMLKGIETEAQRWTFTKKQHKKENKAEKRYPFNYATQKEPVGWFNQQHRMEKKDGSDIFVDKSLKARNERIEKKMKMKRHHAAVDYYSRYLK